jgi:hypothetical protein
MKIKEDLAWKYRNKIETALGSKKPTPQDKEKRIYSKEYEQFRDELLPAQYSLYEKACNYSEKKFKISPPKEKFLELQEAIDSCHLKITPAGAMSFSILGPIAFMFIGSLISFILIQDLFFIIFFMFFGLAMITILGKVPMFIANSWRMKASNQMVLSIFYVVTYMRHTSNLENAIDFAGQHLSPPLSLDFRKILWDVETEKYESIKESLEAYLETWKKYNREFIEAMHLIMSSLYEGDETRRLSVLDKSLTVILEETYEKMLHYAHSLKSPITMLHMLGVILPILGLVILPLVVSFMEGVEWYHISLLYNVALPVGIFYLGKKILANRPNGYGDADISSNPRLQKEQKICLNLGIKKYYLNPLAMSMLVGSILIMIGISPLMLHMFNSSETFDICLGDRGIIKGDKLEGTVKGICLLDYKEDKIGNLKGPYGLGSTLLGIAIPLAIGLGISLYFRYKSKNIMKIRMQTKSLETEFASALFQLGGRLGDGMPTEMAFGTVAQSMSGTESGNFFQLVDGNIKRLGMSVEDAIFDNKHGAIKSFPSDLIKSSMKVLVESAKKGPRIAAQALTNVARYIKELHRVDERLKDLMGEIVGSMKSQVKFLTPVISGIVVGITSMITGILGRLSGTIGKLSSEGGMGAGGVMDMFGVGIPTYNFQIVVGVYVVQLGVILILLSNGIENGVDKLNAKYRLGTDLIRSVILYSAVSFIIILIFNIIANSIMGSTI